MQKTSLLASWEIALFIAYRTLRRGSKATLGLIISMITLSLINLLFFSSLMAGMSQSVLDQFKKNVYSNVIIRPERGQRYISSAGTLENVIATIPNVLAIGPRINSNATFRYDALNDGNYTEGSFQLTGINPSLEQEITGVYKSMVEGTYLNVNDQDSIIIGKDMAGSALASTTSSSNRGMGALLGGGGGGMPPGGGGGFSGGGGSSSSRGSSSSSGSRVDNLGGVNIGDKVLVTFSNSVERYFTVKGIFQTKSTALDSKAFFNNSELGKILGVAALASEIVVKTDEKQTTEEAVIAEIQQAGYSKLTINSWKDMTSSVASINSSFEVVNVVFSVISLVITAITIFIIIFINVTNKRRHIGGLKAIGIHKNIIIWSNVFLGLLYVIVGISIGIIFTYGVVVPFSVQFPIKMPMGESSLLVSSSTVIIGSTGMVVVAIFSSFFPSWSVARQSILKTLWG